ncbi:MAG: CRISPR-associated protein Csh2 [Clostridiales bacterium]|jgi:CRISPR-associated protein Csh2|nr:CRISPR-associated protein Csh2 [Clostridiales bacterium]
MAKMNNRVYGVIGIVSKMANWNADFTGRPKTTSDGDIYGSDKACKYAMKKMWSNDANKKVLYIRSYKIDPKAKGDLKDKLQPKELIERYQEIFGTEKLEKKTPSKEVLKNLFSAIDVMNFGAAFAVADHNISITGAVQIHQGFNKYEDSKVEVQDILSPFRNSKNEEADMTSLGKKIVSDEAHYFYPFSVNPENYNDFIGLVDDFEGYTKEAYYEFKNAALVAATALNTNSKAGCENEFALFIECKENSQLYLPNLCDYISFEKGTDKNIIDLSKLAFVVNTNIAESIENIEIYYNPYTTTIKHSFGDNAKLINIFTREAL